MTYSRQLYQFPLSLYCEKTRWNLDWKQLDWQPVNLIPGPHVLRAWPLARQRTLPILRDGRKIIGDSTAIALYLEQHYPQHALLPKNSSQSREILELENEFDALGADVRRCVWSLAVDSHDIDVLFFRGYENEQRRIGHWMRPALRQMIRHTFDVWPEPVESSWLTVFRALEKVESRLHKDADRYLVGDQFSLADLTAASMLAPLLGPAGSPWLDEYMPATAMTSNSITSHAELRQKLRSSLAGQWINRLYGQHRPRTDA
ncbi:MAG: glutathione S-transferase family protein [Moraxellaceae bacterium]